jgi:protein translocase SecG subunit
MFPAFIAAAATTVASPIAKATTLELTPELLKTIGAQGPAPVLYPQSPLAQHFGWLTHGFAGIFIVSAVLLIVLLAVQTTKQEGLSGTIGGRVESAYKGRVGFDKQLQRITTAVAITFVIFAAFVSLSGI